MIRRLIEYLAPPPIQSRATLQRFVGGEASSLAQRATFEFTRNALGYYGQTAFHDDPFVDAFRLCRWESFAAILADMVVLTEGLLRPHGAALGVPSLADALAPLFDAALGEYPPPAHRADGWADEAANLRERLARATLAAPPGAGDVARVSARRVFEVLPVYSHNRDVDRLTIENAVRFGMIAFHDRMRARLRPRLVLEELLGGRPARTA